MPHLVSTMREANPLSVRKLQFENHINLGSRDDKYNMPLKIGIGPWDSLGFFTSQGNNTSLCLTANKRSWYLAVQIRLVQASTYALKLGLMSSNANLRCSSKIDFKGTEHQFLVSYHAWDIQTCP